jgi:hypothetical protein
VWLGVVCAGVLIATLLPAAAAQAQSTKMPAHDAPAAEGAYAPGLGEIMTLQQMRHVKLWFAGRARNWPLASYELDELKEGFEDVAKYHAMHNDIPLAPMVEAVTEKEIADLGKAIEARSTPKFTGAFDHLTAACNACHQAANHPFIAIRRPTSLPYTNQDFAPAKR